MEHMVCVCVCVYKCDQCIKNRCTGRYVAHMDTNMHAQMHDKQNLLRSSPPALSIILMILQFV